MTPRNRIVVTICMLANIADGIDALVAALVSPVLVGLWSISARSLGVLLASGALGTVLGVATLSPFADKYGRRNLVVIGQIIVVAAMLASVFATNVEALIVLRIMSGAGIGCINVLVNIIGAEQTPQEKRALAMILISAGTPLGFTLGSAVAIPLLHHFPWWSMFVAGAAASLLVLVIVICWLPESEEYLHLAGTRRAIKSTGFTAVLRGRMLTSTILLALSVSAVGTASHFLVQWTPKSLTEAGLSLASSLSGSVLLNAGVLSGLVLFAFIANRWGVKRMGVAVMILAFLSAAAFALAPAKLEVLMPLAFLVGGTLGPSTGILYAMIAQVYPPAVRASGTAVAMGLGRTGSILGPLLGGVLVEAGLGRAIYTIILVTPFLIGALALGLTPTTADPRGMTTTDRKRQTAHKQSRTNGTLLARFPKLQKIRRSVGRHLGA